MSVKKLWTPSTLPDYVHGEWIPTIVQDGVTYKAQHVVYTRVGNVIHVTGTIIVGVLPS